MKIAVLNGSPKGDLSVTIRSVRYMELAGPDHSFDIIPIASEINRIARDEAYFDALMQRISGVDAVLFAFPLYVMLVPAQFKRFIELVFERGAGIHFQGKYAASISTSVHFMDHIAHNYIHAIAEDLGMHFVGAFSAHMQDLLKEEERKRLELFSSMFIETIQKKPVIQPIYPQIRQSLPSYTPVLPLAPLEQGNLRILILTDHNAPDSNCAKMVNRLKETFGGKATIAEIPDIGMKGGCLGCCRCGYDNTCVYTDGFSEWYRNTLLSSDIIIFAGEIHDRFLSSGFKQVFDRSFFMGHIPAFKGRTIGYMVSGPLCENPVLMEFFRAFTDSEGVLCGHIISDESDDPAEIDRRIDSFASSLISSAGSGYSPPPTFYAVGGHKIFRDMIWGGMRAIFRADHRYFKRNKLYDFPQYQYTQRLRSSLLRLLLVFPPARRSVFLRMKEHMVEAHDRVLEAYKQ
ncbi:NAD(P)H-dependent oxidoreductase [Methanocalculus sp.]|uniref:NAD(P)H-dependent oxidoreductase n=1 Tax=Methanocalculus sp. TaxID=2004547 RepID=UPI002617137F|nr:NAD(P)H-dependent oxidoreductase [Methanocalculus sp.]MDG6249623.1 NAD(P)H-dependent oxidoreductase [Methanocalculus sp.]